MKKTVLILSLVLLISSFNSCEDSLGLDPEVHITQLDKPIKDTTDTHFTPAFIEWINLTEVYDENGNWGTTLSSDSVRVLNYSIWADTSTTDTLLSMDFTIQSPISVDEYKGLKNKLIDFRVHFDSINLTQKKFNHIDSNFHVTLYDLYTQKSEVLNYSQIRTSFKHSLVHIYYKKDKEYLEFISCTIEIIIPRYMNDREKLSKIVVMSIIFL